HPAGRSPAGRLRPPPGRSRGALGPAGRGPPAESELRHAGPPLSARPARRRPDRNQAMTAGRPLIVTMGDPAGVGPEIIARAWPILAVPPGPLAPVTPFVVVGDADALAAQGQPVEAVLSPADAAAVFGRAIPVLHSPAPAPVVPGRPDPANAPAVADWIERGVDLILSGEGSGLVTAPIAKAPMYASGFRFPGHTEFIAELTADIPFSGTRGPVMML